MTKNHITTCMYAYVAINIVARFRVQSTNIHSGCSSHEVMTGPSLHYTDCTALHYTAQWQGPAPDKLFHISCITYTQTIGQSSTRLHSGADRTEQNRRRSRQNTQIESLIWMNCKLIMLAFTPSLTPSLPHSLTLINSNFVPRASRRVFRPVFKCEGKKEAEPFFYQAV
jgi:hypothetical protein